jgi:hypothetical protein
MATKLHSLVVEGSRHAIHNLTYANAANRIAGTGEGSGINPPTADNLWQIAKQNDDDSLWMLVDESPLTWKQIPVGVSGTPTIDDTYNNFGSNPSTVVVDAAQGQGTALKFDMSSAAADRFFEVALDNGQNPTGDPAVYHTGFTVTNGADNWTVARAGADQINLVGAIENILLEVANIFQIETDSVELKLLSDVASGNFVDLFGDGKLTGASGTQRYLDIAPAINQSGTAGYDGLRVNPAITAVGSGEQNLLNLQLGGANRFRVASDGNTRIGTGTPGSATGAGSLYVTDALEAGGASYLGTINISLGSLISGGSTIGSIELRNSAQNLDGPILLTGSNSNAWILAEYGDRSYDFAHTLQTNPTLIGHSANQSTTEWWSLSHDQTHARFLTGTGTLCIGTGTPSKVSASGSLYVTNGAQIDTKINLFGTIFFEGGANSGLSWGTSSAPTRFYMNETTDQLLLACGADLGRQLVIGEYNYATSDYGHATPTNPTLFGHAATDPTGAGANHWWSLTHNQTDGVLATGAGALSLAPASGAVNLIVSQAAATSMLVNNASDNAAADSQTEWRSGTSVESSLIVGQRNTAYTTAVYRDRGFMITDTDSLGILIAARKSTGTIDFYAGESTPATKRISVTSSGMSMGDASQTLYDIAPASNLTATGDTVSATVDTNATGIGAALYQAADGNWDEADADAIATMPCRALALETGTGTKLILRRGWIRIDGSGWTPGAPVYVSTTTGGLTQTKPSGTGDQVQIVGYAETATVLDFNPSMTIVEVA